jgi:trans-AT polyketide synthase/acyltransferase/oxidoreductase domain-containing protein
MAVFMFPGQGSQFKGMGAALFSQFPKLIAKANQILGYSIEELCTENPENKLNQTQYTQPALYVVNSLMYFDKILQISYKPNYVLGHSLGEYSALLAAEVFDFQTGLKLVKKRGELMSQSQEGGMAAIIGWRIEEIVEILERRQSHGLTIANYNDALQTVISGSKEDINNAKNFFNAKGLYKILNVSGAFHSPYMLPAQLEFKKFINQFSFKKPNVITIANINAKPYVQSDIANNLATHLVKSVMWYTSITYLIQQGEHIFHEIGPGNILKTLINKIINNYRQINY